MFPLSIFNLFPYWLNFWLEEDIDRMSLLLSSIKKKAFRDSHMTFSEVFLENQDILSCVGRGDVYQGRMEWSGYN